MIKNPSKCKTFAAKEAKKPLEGIHNRVQRTVIITDLKKKNLKNSKT